MSELDVQISGEVLVLAERVDINGLRDSTSAEIMVVPPTIAVVQSEVDSATQVVCRCDTDAVNIQLAIKPIIIDQVLIERVLLLVLIPNVDLPIVFRL